MCSFLSVDNFVSGGDLLLIFKLEVGSNKVTLVESVSIPVI